MTLHDRMRRNEFGYAFANSSDLACKIWALENDWEALLIHDPNAKLVPNAMILWRKTQNKRMMRVSTHSNIDNVDKESELISLHFNKL